ncbi:MAG: TolC family protein, partial [Candidatus Omnitrophica bacterium]|nr:TolC family protein [Candidatus Omnitrophota bacterium]
MKKISLLIILYYMVCISNANAEVIFTWQNCVNEAKQNNPDLESAFEQVNQAKDYKDITVTPMLPQIDADITGTRRQTSSKSSSGENTERTGNTYTYGLTAQQLIFDGFKTSSEVSSAVKTLKAQEYNYAVVSSNIRLDLRSAFAE